MLIFTENQCINNLCAPEFKIYNFVFLNDFKYFALLLIMYNITFIAEHYFNHLIVTIKQFFVQCTISQYSACQIQLNIKHVNSSETDVLY